MTAVGDEVVAFYVCRGGDLARLAPEVAARARLAPCDTLVNERLGTKLAAR